MISTKLISALAKLSNYIKIAQKINSENKLNDNEELLAYCIIYSQFGEGIKNRLESLDKSNITILENISDFNNHIFRDIQCHNDIINHENMKRVDKFHSMVGDVISEFCDIVLENKYDITCLDTYPEVAKFTFTLMFIPVFLHWKKNLLESFQMVIEYYESIKTMGGSFNPQKKCNEVYSHIISKMGSSTLCYIDHTNFMKKTKKFLDNLEKNNNSSNTKK